MQSEFATQSAFDAQLSRQLPDAPQTRKFGQATDGARQLPAASQKPLLVYCAPVHVCATQFVAAVAKWQLAVSAPLQESPHCGSVVFDAHSRAPCGAPMTREQTPTLPVRSHASHAPGHAVSQQTPSVQWPLVHSEFAAHAAPAVRVAEQA